MKTLKTIQVLAKIGKIFSNIIFVLCIVGFCGCVLGIVSLAIGFTSAQLGGITLKGILQNEAGLTDGTLYASMTVGAIFCAAEAVLSKFAAHYFNRELADGTPFTLGGAKELLRLGILAICISLGTQTIAQIAHAIFAHTMAEVAPLELSSFGSVGIGIMMILTSLICKYGAELREGKDA